MKKETIVRLTAELKDMKLKYSEEKEKNVKENKIKIKQWKKELGEEKKS